MVHAVQHRGAEHWSRSSGSGPCKSLVRSLQSPVNLKRMHVMLHWMSTMSCRPTQQTQRSVCRAQDMGVHPAAVRLIRPVLWHNRLLLVHRPVPAPQSCLTLDHMLLHIHKAMHVSRCTQGVHLRFLHRHLSVGLMQQGWPQVCSERCHHHVAVCGGSAGAQAQGAQGTHHAGAPCGANLHQLSRPIVSNKSSPLEARTSYWALQPKTCFLITLLSSKTRCLKLGSMGMAC